MNSGLVTFAVLNRRIDWLKARLFLFRSLLLSGLLFRSFLFGLFRGLTTFDYHFGFFLSERLGLVQGSGNTASDES
jgi:hypothetical protein